MYNVEYGVHGGYRIRNREFAFLLDAESFARRWARTNSRGHYWAEITLDGRLVTRFNLA
jgi:hypothetical protein